MKKIVAVLVLAFAGSAFAHGPHGVPYHHHGSWIGPAIVGGVIGYVVAQPRTVVVQQQPPVVIQQPVPVQQQVCENRYVPDSTGVMRLATVCWNQ